MLFRSYIQQVANESTSENKTLVLVEKQDWDIIYGSLLWPDTEITIRETFLLQGPRLSLLSDRSGARNATHTNPGYPVTNRFCREVESSGATPGYRAAWSVPERVAATCEGLGLESNASGDAGFTLTSPAALNR